MAAVLLLFLASLFAFFALTAAPGLASRLARRCWWCRPVLTLALFFALTAVLYCVLSVVLRLR